MRIRLHGIDAPESDQPCTVRDERVACGRLAAMALAGKIGGRLGHVRAEGARPVRPIVAVCRSGGETEQAIRTALAAGRGIRKVAIE